MGARTDIPDACMQLRDVLLPRARALLDAQGAFPTFGGYVVPPGRVVEVGFVSPAPASAEALAAELAEIDAAAVAHALVFPMHLPAPRDGMEDAIRLHLSHRDGACVEVVVPYRARRAMPTLFGAPIVLAGVPFVFGLR